MTSLEHHDLEHAATASIAHSTTLRTRLLAELDDLERALKAVRRVAEQLPEDGVAMSDNALRKRGRWKLWKHS